MTPERWQQIKDLFEAVSERDPVERSAFLDKVCAEDKALRLEVESLLASDEQAGSFIEAPAFEAADMLVKQIYALQPGALLQGRYLVTRSIARGGMGAVYEAIDQRLGSNVALKHCFFSDERLSKAFEREARLLASLRHFALPKVTDHFTEGNNQFLIMEFIPGKDLAELLDDEGRTFTVDEVLNWLDKLLDALNYLHSHNPPILHRDIKPNNLKLTDQGQIILLDFGLAKGSASPRSRVTSTGSIFGYTPHYAPLEQIQGSGSDPRSDLYSLGATAYHLVTSTTPPDALTRATLILEAHADPLRPPMEINPDVSPAFSKLLLDVMSLNRDLRPPGAAMMQKALRSITDSQTQVFGSSQSSSGGSTSYSSYSTDGVAERSPAGRDSNTDRSFFIAGPPITSARNFFGREREVKRIFALLKQSPLQNAAIVGPQRSGKTSLLHYLKNITRSTSSQLRHGQRQDWLPLPENYRWIFVDFQDSRMCSREGLLRYLLDCLSLKQPGNIDLDRFLDTVSDNLKSRTVILMDEISVAMQRCPELDNSLWEGMRSLATNLVDGNLAFVLAAPDLPQHLAGESGLGSPFFNIFGYTATLGPLTTVEAEELLSSSPIPFSTDDIDWILTQSGRWPILLQILARERLMALESDESGNEWREEGLRQMARFRHLLG